MRAKNSDGRPLVAFVSYSCNWGGYATSCTGTEYYSVSTAFYKVSDDCYYDDKKRGNSRSHQPSMGRRRPDWLGCVVQVAAVEAAGGRMRYMDDSKYTGLSTSIYGASTYQVRRLLLRR